MLLVTFNAHYGSVLLNKKYKKISKIRPVPRKLSSSCADCVIFPELETMDEIFDSIEKEYAEKAYIVDGDNYKIIFDFKNNGDDRT